MIKWLAYKIKWSYLLQLYIITRPQTVVVKVQSLYQLREVR